MRHRLFIGALLTAAMHAAPAQTPTQQGAALTWTIDANHSAVQCAVRHMRVSSVRGQFVKLSGTVRMCDIDVRSSASDVTIEAVAVDTRVAKRDTDLRGPKFLDTEQGPAITFVSKKAEPVDATHVEVIGDLIMHRLTREVVRDGKGPSAPLTQGQVGRIGASATTKSNRRDCGLQCKRVGEGTMVVGDESQITLDVDATRRLP
jgi:polyisoprenoid-binding protein YceI